MSAAGSASGSRPEILAALPTFFDDAGELDRPTTLAHLRWVAERVDGVFVAGTTGEFPALDRDERTWLTGSALEVLGPARVVVHVGAAATRESVHLTRDAVAAGARRIAALTPFYLPVDEAATTRHLAAVAEGASDAEVYAYLFEERTGVATSPEALGRIADATGLAGLKLSGAANADLPSYVEALPPGARLWSGSDTDLARVVRAGGAGVVSGLSAALPGPFAALADAVADGDADAEARAQADADAVLEALGGTIEGIKHALGRLGFGNGSLRMPAPPVARADAVERLAAAS